ncbi:MAG: ABC transporter permease [Saprospiraceae bacterium]|jgi:ABC-type antimicrobial peptide transport system permease subunit|nr:ABC transporter permease [Saprospiraceae bacterium]
MIKNYITIALRNLMRARQYTLINVIGLGIGLAAIVWAFQIYRFSFSFDDFHPDQERVFRALSTKEGNDAPMGFFPMPAVQLAKGDFSSIEAAVRIRHNTVDVKAGKNEPFMEPILFTDLDFFSVFNFPLLKGQNDLNDRSAILITEEIATKYFGDEDPIGKEMVLYAGTEFPKPLTVKGVLKNTPNNSTISFKLLTNYENLQHGDGTPAKPDEWNSMLDAAFFKLKTPEDAGRLAADFKKYLPLQNAARADWKMTGFSLVSLKEHAQMSDISVNHLEERPKDSAIFGPLVLGLLIWISTCLNFTNTTVARSNQRLKEMGVRKVMGGRRSQLTTQMLLECFAIVVMAFGVAVFLNSLWLPSFSSMFFIEVRAEYLTDGVLLAFIGLAVVLTTLLAGAYPAFYISRFNPTQIFKGSVKFGDTSLFSRLLLGLQVSIAMITVIGSLGFAENAEFQRTYDYGYDRENVVNIPTQNASELAAMKAAVQQIPGVEAVAGTHALIGFNLPWRTIEAEGQIKEGSVYSIGADFMEVMQMKMVEGRAFDPKLESDFDNALLVNETMAGNFGWTAAAAIGKTIRLDTQNFTVVGTMKDFHGTMLFGTIDPAAMRLVRPEAASNLVLRAKPGEVVSVFDQSKAVWEKLFPMKPYRGYYQNEVAAEAMRVTTGISAVNRLFAIITLLLTATGLYALVSLTLLKRMREIAIRKVMGASSINIVALVNKRYFWIFLFGAAIGCFGGFALTKLLMDMIFKINSGLNPATLAISIAILFLVAVATVGVKVWGVLRTNPAEVLKGD